MDNFARLFCKDNERYGKKNQVSLFFYPEPKAKFGRDRNSLILRRQYGIISGHIVVLADTLVEQGL